MTLKELKQEIEDMIENYGEDKEIRFRADVYTTAKADVVVNTYFSDECGYEEEVEEQEVEVDLELFFELGDDIEEDGKISIYLDEV